MRRFLKALILLPVAIVVVLLAVANRTPVTFSFDPTRSAPDLAVTLPLYAFLFMACATAPDFAATSGSSTEKRVPWPIVLSQVMVPPCSCTMP